MYDLRAIKKTYLETYLANGGNTTLAKQVALDTHKVPESERWRVASELSGSNNWDKPSEVRHHYRRRTINKKLKKRPATFTQGMIDFKTRAAGDKD